MPHSFRSILSAVDFDENSLKALETAAELARLAGAALFVLHILPTAGSSPKPAGVDALVAREQAVKEKLTGLCRDRLAGLRYEVLTRTGDPAIGIIHAEEELNADLVVIATHSGRMKPRPFSGSVAERIIRESICPVLTVRPSPSGDADAVGSHMTPSPLIASPDSTVDRVWQMMSQSRLRSLPVLEGDKVVGMVTDRDLAFSDATGDTAIGLLMTRDVVPVSPMTSMREAALLLFESEVEGLPVIENQKLVGMITRSDILKVFAQAE